MAIVMCIVSLPFSGVAFVAVATQVIDVKLTRTPQGESFGFAIAVLADEGIVISRISSNISNWGMLQIGDELLSLQGVRVQDMTHDDINRVISTTTAALELQVARCSKLLCG